MTLSERLERSALRKFPKPVTQCHTEKAMMKKLREWYKAKVRERYKRLFKKEL